MNDHAYADGNSNIFHQETHLYMEIRKFEDRTDQQTFPFESLSFASLNRRKPEQATMMT